MHVVEVGQHHAVDRRGIHLLVSTEHRLSDRIAEKPHAWIAFPTGTRDAAAGATRGTGPLPRQGALCGIAPRLCPRRGQPLWPERLAAALHRRPQRRRLHGLLGSDASPQPRGGSRQGHAVHCRCLSAGSWSWGKARGRRPRPRRRRPCCSAKASAERFLQLKEQEAVRRQLKHTSNAVTSLVSGGWRAPEKPCTNRPGGQKRSTDPPRNPFMMMVKTCTRYCIAAQGMFGAGKRRRTVACTVDVAECAFCKRHTGCL